MSVFPDGKFVLNMPDVSSGGCSILMLGSGRAGKTTALKWIIDHYFTKHVGAIFSQSAKAQAYSHMKYPLLPLSCAFIPELMNDAYHINMETKNHYPFLFVLDDVPLAKSFISQRKTDLPRPTASRAMPQPLTPPPMIARS